MKKEHRFSYEHYDSPAALPEADRALVAEAERATARAYAPYSKFRVGPKVCKYVYKIAVAVTPSAS